MPHESQTERLPAAQRAVVRRREKCRTEGEIFNSNTPLKRLLPRHFKIISLSLAGMSNKEIAAVTGMTEGAISRIVSSPVFQSEIERRRRRQESVVDESLGGTLVQAKQILESAAAKAAKTQVELLSEESPVVRQRASTSILDRVLGQNNQSVNGSVVVIAPEQLNLLQIALSESRSCKEDHQND